MVEQLSFIAIALLVVLAASLLIPTRRQTPRNSETVGSAVSSDSSALVQNLYALAIQSWTTLNTVRYFCKVDTTATSEEQSLRLTGLLRCTPSSWLEPKSKLLDSTRLADLCSESNIANRQWCLYAFPCSFKSESATSDSLQSDLAFRQFAQQNFGLLSHHGLVSGSNQACILLAVPILADASALQVVATTLAKKLYTYFSTSKVVMGGIQYEASCQTKFCIVQQGSEIARAIVSLLSDENAISPVRFLSNGTWTDIKVDAPAPQPISPKPTAGDTIEVVSAETAAELAANCKTTPAAFGIRDDAPSASPVESKSAATPVAASSQPANNADASQQDQVAANQDTSNQNSKPEEPVVNNNPKTEDSASDTIDSSDIDELFAIARRRQDQDPKVAQAPTANVTDEQEALEKIQEIQQVADSTLNEKEQAEATSNTSDAVTAEDIAKLFAAAKARS